MDLGNLNFSVTTNMASLKQDLDMTQRGLQVLHRNMDRLDQKFQEGKVSVEQYARKSTELRARISELQGDTLRLTEGLRQQSAATFTAANAMHSLKGGVGTMQQATRSTRDLGRGFLEVSRAVEDAQYGLAGVLNNLPGIISMFGGASGLAAAVSLTSVAAYTLYKNWDRVMGAVGQRVAVPAIDTSSLEGAQERLKAVKKEIDDLRERGQITAAESVHFGELQTEEKDLKEAIKLKQRIEHLKEQRTEVAEAAIRGLEQSITESGSGDTIKKIEEVLNNYGAIHNDPSASVEVNKIRMDRAKKEADQFRKDFYNGDRSAYTYMIEIAKSIFGRKSKFVSDLQRHAPWVQEHKDTTSNMMDAFKQIRDKHESERKDRQELAAQGRENEEQMLSDMSEGASKKVLARHGNRLEAMAIKLQSAGLSERKQIDAMSGTIASEFAKTEKALAEFPDALSDASRALAKKVIQTTEQMITDLEVQENLTRTEAIRRINAQAEAKIQGNQQNLATEEFSQAALSENARMRKFNPRMAKMTQADAAKAGQARQSALSDIGLSAQDQVGVGKLSNSKLAPQANAHFNALVSSGVDQKTAYEETLRTFEGGKKVNLGAAFGRSMNRLMHDQGEEAAMGMGQNMDTGGRAKRRVARQQKAYANRPKPLSMDEHNQKAWDDSERRMSLPKDVSDAIRIGIGMDNRKIGERNDLFQRTDEENEQRQKDRRAAIQPQIDATTKRDNARAAKIKEVMAKNPKLGKRMASNDNAKAGIDAMISQAIFGAPMGSMASLDGQGVGGSQGGKDPAEKMSSTLDDVLVELKEIKNKRAIGVLV